MPNFLRSQKFTLRLVSLNDICLHCFGGDSLMSQLPLSLQAREHCLGHPTCSTCLLEDFSKITYIGKYIIPPFLAFAAWTIERRYFKQLSKITSLNMFKLEIQSNQLYICIVDAEVTHLYPYSVGLWKEHNPISIASEYKPSFKSNGCRMFYTIKKCISRKLLHFKHHTLSVTRCRLLCGVWYLRFLIRKTGIYQ